ncbi:MAG TPA: OB-fold domain-containing protein [Baekduia sp.]
MERSPADVYTEHCRRRELAYQLDMGSSPPRPVFRPRVGFDTWRVSAGRGTVYATTVVRPRGGEAYNLVLVDLDEGFRMMSRVVGVAPEAVAVGARVLLAWEDGEDDVPLPVFALDAEDGA